MSDQGRVSSVDLTKAAQKWALVKFIVDLQQRDAEDSAAACEANGWQMRSAHDLYDDVIDTVSRLATGSLDAQGYLDEERRLHDAETAPARTPASADAEGGDDDDRS